MPPNFSLSALSAKIDIHLVLSCMRLRKINKICVGWLTLPLKIKSYVCMTEHFSAFERIIADYFLPDE
jgi:hypothetical protein